MIAHTIGRRFNLMFEETKQGLPEGVQFQSQDFKRPPTNVKGSMMKIAVETSQMDPWEGAITDGCDINENDTSNKDAGNKE